MPFGEIRQTPFRHFLLQSTHHMPSGPVLPKSLEFDIPLEIARITAALRAALDGPLRRRGFVVAMSGGIDSSVCAALAVEAVGPKRVLGLLLPERDSDPLSRELATQLADQLGIAYEVEDIAPTLFAAGCYARRDAAAAMAEPRYGSGWRCKLVLPTQRAEGNSINVSALEVCAPGGEPYRVRLPALAYRQLVAAVNFKQRVRKMFEYYHADRQHFAVIGTPNRLEYDQGFFVKGGDGLADVKPIAHLYKTQAYAIARHLGVPDGIVGRPPTTDTFSLPQSQEEFYFSLPHEQLDVALHGFNTGRSPAAVAEDLGLSVAVVEHTYRDIVQKRATTHSLHVSSLLVEPIPLGTSEH